MAKKFNYFAAGVLVIIANLPVYVFSWFFGFSTKADLSFLLAISIAMLIFIPVLTIYFLKRFSSGINIKNALVLAVIVSSGSFLLDSLFFGFVLGLGFSYLNNPIFPIGHIMMLFLTPLTAIFAKK